MRTIAVKFLWHILNKMFFSYRFGGFERLPRPLARLRSWAWRTRCRDKNDTLGDRCRNKGESLGGER